MKFLFLFLFLIDILLGVDISVDYDSSKSIKRDKSVSVLDSNTITKLTSSSKSNSVSTSVDLSLLLVDDLDFSCTNNPKTLNHFGLGFMEHGSVNITKKEYLVNAGANSMFLGDIGINDSAVIEYVSCLVNAGAKLAQASLNFSKFANVEMSEKQFDLALKKSVFEADHISSLKIKMIHKNALKNLQLGCRFFNSHETLMCGKIVLDMSAMNSNRVSYLNHILFGDGSSNFGVSSVYEIALSESDNSDISIASVEESSQSKSTSLSKNKNSKKSLSIGKFLPGL